MKEVGFEGRYLADNVSHFLLKCAYLIQDPVLSSADNIPVRLSPSPSLSQPVLAAILAARVAFMNLSSLPTVPNGSPSLSSLKSTHTCFKLPPGALEGKPQMTRPWLTLCLRVLVPACAEGPVLPVAGTGRGTATGCGDERGVHLTLMGRTRVSRLLRSCVVWQCVNTQLSCHGRYIFVLLFYVVIIRCDKMACDCGTVHMIYARADIT